jgi:hypothetical protein
LDSALFHIAAIVRHHRRSPNVASLTLVQIVDFRDGDVVTMAEPILETLGHAPLVLQRQGFEDTQAKFQHANNHTVHVPRSANDRLLITHAR